MACVQISSFNRVRLLEPTNCKSLTFFLSAASFLKVAGPIWRAAECRLRSEDLRYSWKDGEVLVIQSQRAVILLDLDKLSICLILSCTFLTSSTIGVFVAFPGVNRSCKVLREAALGDGGVVPWNSPRQFRFSRTSSEAFADDDSPCTGELTREELALVGAEEEGLVLPFVVFDLFAWAISVVISP